MSGLGFGPGHLVLLEEACRAADTLERLNAMLAADEADWLELARNDAESDGETTELRVVVNGLLVEQRQQQANLRQIVAELRLSGRAASPAAGQAPVSAPESTPAPSAPAGDEGGLGDLIDAAGRFTSQG